jgi:hypothetical protein
MLTQLTPSRIDRFTPEPQRRAALRDVGAKVIGQSEQGREIHGIVIGTGPRKVSLVAGAHSDEPVGPETLRVLVEALAGAGAAGDGPARRLTFVIVPHVNPDGEAAQRPWLKVWPNPMSYMVHRLREPPGRDVEFGYPDQRPENAAVGAFLADHGPFALHMSLHGMSVASGGWHLIERSWVDRTAALRDHYAGALRAAGLELFDWDRGGEKGFEYIGPGFATTPRSDAMRRYFEDRDERETASRFAMNSMEHVRRLGGDPLCMVTELPLWMIDAEGIADQPGRPNRYLAFREAVAAGQAALAEGRVDQAMNATDRFSMRPLPIATAVGLHLRAIELGLAAIGEAPPAPSGRCS